VVTGVQTCALPISGSLARNDLCVLRNLDVKQVF